MTGKSNVLLVGSGGVGTIVSLGLELSGKASVTSVLRSDYEKVIKHGFDIESVDHGTFFSWRPTNVVNSVQSAVDQLKDGQQFDYIVVCTKVLPELFKTEYIIEPAVASGHTVIVLFQNGIGIEQPVAERFPNNCVLSGVSMIGSANYGGKIVQNEHDKSVVGYYKSSNFTIDKLESCAKAFVKLYSSSGVECKFAPDLLFARWKKLVYNSTINTVCALTQLDTGRAYLSGMDKSLILPAMQEIKAVADIALTAEGLPPLPDKIDIIMLESDDGLYYKPSMLVDVEKGNPIELEAILGNPLRIAKELDVQTPILSVIYAALRGVQFRLMATRGYIRCPENGPTRRKDKAMW
jgi:2-dehydropantoate 2-reductase